MFLEKNLNASRSEHPTQGGGCFVLKEKSERIETF